jgi:hypothetical protein
MGTEPFDTMGEILESAESETDDPEVEFKLRTARQLLMFLEEQHEAGRAVLERSDLDEETRDSLRRLGYLE